MSTTDLQSTIRPYILFDFDGTIADSMPLIMHIYRELSVKYHLNSASDAELLDWRGLSARQILKKSGVSALRVLPLLKEGKELFGQHINRVEPIQGMPEALNRLARTHHLGIVTSNSETNVRLFLHKHQLPEFHFIHSDKTIFGKGAVLKRVIKHYQINPEATVYVGDEIRDIHAAHNAKLPCIAVSWGLNTHQALQAHQPLTIIDHPQKLVSFLEK